ncbi:alkylmercury lyase family protein [Corynebacterium lubricantis]|uniref:alkylmercury lyase family protein n=1 Tax=Corynebacterium lubricantis TaxID=541095 RepID=UPI0003A02594|nr:alkylmercury lyase family protein [Corynebacterium lubricantis]
MTPIAVQTRQYIYRTFAERGDAPSVGELARVQGVSRKEMDEVLRELADAHAVVLAADGDAIRMSHPFSASPMAFTVTPQDGFDDRRWWGGCAWDSFGMSAAVGVDVRIDTACPQCGNHLNYTAGPAQPPIAEHVVRFPRPAAQWWPEVVHTCTNIRTFCSAEHAEAWTAENAPGEGYIAPLKQVWELAVPWYGDRLRDDFTPHSTAQNQQILNEVGLTGEFWELP